MDTKHVVLSLIDEAFARIRDINNAALATNAQNTGVTEYVKASDMIRIGIAIEHLNESITAIENDTPYEPYLELAREAISDLGGYGHIFYGIDKAEDYVNTTSDLLWTALTTPKVYPTNLMDIVVEHFDKQQGQTV